MACAGGEQEERAPLVLVGKRSMAREEEHARAVRRSLQVGLTGAAVLWYMRCNVIYIRTTYVTGTNNVSVDGPNNSTLCCFV